MAKKAKKEIIIDPILIDEDLLSDPIKEPIKVKQPSVEKPKDKVLLGYHPITGAEVWQ
tara:strand:+ start:279 stop:452 length:174 start_codon:yes stop_codon:yes gene_type:complete